MMLDICLMALAATIVHANYWLFVWGRARVRALNETAILTRQHAALAAPLDGIYREALAPTRGGIWNEPVG